jgi:tRNA threonylcarbamoyladenosine biosynthesis protein TsaE
MEITTSSTQETQKLAQRLAGKIVPNAVLALYGDLGSGKTTFTSYLVSALGFIDRVQSPTFIIMRHYNKKRDNALKNDIKKVYHVDLYRLTSAEEVLDLGWQEMLSEKDAIMIIEWPELVEDLLPAETIKIKFEYLEENVRKINIQNLS